MPPTPSPCIFHSLCPGQGMGFGKVGTVTCAQIHGWVEFRGAEGNPGAGRRKGTAGEGRRERNGAEPELEKAQGFGGRGCLCATIATGPPPARPPHISCPCRSRGAVPEEGSDYHWHLRGSAGCGHRLRGRLLQDQVSGRRSGQARPRQGWALQRLLREDRLSSPPPPPMVPGQPPPNTCVYPHCPLQFLWGQRAGPRGRSRRWGRWASGD